MSPVTIPASVTMAAKTTGGVTVVIPNVVTIVTRQTVVRKMENVNLVVREATQETNVLWALPWRQVVMVQATRA